MWTRIKQFFSAPVFQDPEQTRVARLLHNILNALVGMTLVTAFFLIATNPTSFFKDPSNPVAILVVLATAMALRALVHRGHLQLTSALIASALVLITIFVTYGYGGVNNSATVIYLVCIILAGLLLGGRGAVIFAAISVAAVIGLGYADAIGQLPTYPESRDSLRTFNMVAYSAIFVVVGLLLRYAAGSLSGALEQARRNERAEAEANRELRKLRASLEQQVVERTQALERRAVQLQAAAEVGRTVTAVLETEQLTRQVVQLVRQRFEFHYVGLFLVDESGQWVVLQAGDGKTSTDLGGYRVPLKGSSLVSQSIMMAQVRTATHAEELPEARSVAVLPLYSRERAFGVLAMYSDQLDTFDRDTLIILETVADQVAVALDNARLFAQSRAALEQAQRAYGQFSQQAWAELLRGRTDLSKRKSQGGTFAVPNLPAPHAQDALQTGRVVLGQEDKASLATPIKVREHVIGVIDARKPDGSGPWTHEEITLLETFAEQLGVALESARLYQDTQRRAVREQLTSQITSRMRESLEVETVLKTAALEMRQALGLDKLVVRLGAQDKQPSQR